VSLMFLVVALSLPNPQVATIAPVRCPHAPHTRIFAVKVIRRAHHYTKPSTLCCRPARPFNKKESRNVRGLCPPSSKLAAADPPSALLLGNLCCLRGAKVSRWTGLVSNVLLLSCAAQVSRARPGCPCCCCPVGVLRSETQSNSYMIDSR
jgi:hypothetical protein